MLDQKKDVSPAGLVMEGGAMRGMFTCGVIDVFMERGITFPAAVGVSAGATFGCNIKSRQIGRAIRYNKRFARDPRYCSFRSLLTTGDLYGAEFCYHTLPDILDPFDHAAFEADPMKFYVAATDVNTGKPVYHLCTDGGENDITWLQASASMPFVSRIVRADGYELLDGGISDSVPYRFMEENGYGRNVIILTRAEGYRKKPSAAAGLMGFTLRRYPALVKAMKERHLMYNRQMEEIEERERDGRAFVIRPPQPLGISRTEHDPAELERVYQTGRSEAERLLPELLEFLKK